MTTARCATLMLVAALSGCATGRARPVAAGETPAALVQAETAVAVSPGSADARLTLARGYVAAGRFTSAAAAYRDVLALAPDERRAVLGLALMEIAGGRIEAAAPLLDRLPTDDVDAALARALAGDAAGAVTRLDRAARQPGADARTRQNLALALAITGRWVAARAVASEDLTPDVVNRRLGEWAVMAGAGNGASRVAALLHVRIVADPGQPAALALGQPAPAGAMPAAVPTVVAAAPASPTPVAVEPATPPASVRPVGRYVVQLGAFADSAGALKAWRERAGAMPGRMPLASLDPRRGDGLVRLSIGGLGGLSDARALCRAVLESGGNCFVRPRANDRPAGWLSA